MGPRQKINESTLGCDESKLRVVAATKFLSDSYEPKFHKKNYGKSSGKRILEALAVLAGDGAGAPARRILKKEIESIQPNLSNTDLRFFFFFFNNLIKNLEGSGRFERNTRI